MANSDSTSQDEFENPKVDNAEKAKCKVREMFGDETTKASKVSKLNFCLQCKLVSSCLMKAQVILLCMTSFFQFSDLKFSFLCICYSIILLVLL